MILTPQAFICCLSSLQSSGFRLSTRGYILAAGICFHSATWTSVRSHTGVGCWVLAQSQHSSSSQKCWVGLRSWLRAGQSRSFTPSWDKHCFMDLFFELLRHKNCCHKDVIARLSRILFFSKIHLHWYPDQNREHSHGIQWISSDFAHWYIKETEFGG